MSRRPLFCALVLFCSILSLSTVRAQDDGAAPSESSGGETIPVGLPAAQDTFPSSARLRPYNDFQEGNCSGTLIHERIIITARHCVLSGAAPNALKSAVSVSLRSHTGCTDGGYSSGRFRLTRSNVFTDMRPSMPTNPSDVHEVSQGKDLALILLPSTVPCANIRVAALYDGATRPRQISVAGFGLSLNLRKDAQGRLVARPGPTDWLLYLSDGQLSIRSGNLTDPVFQLQSDLTISYKGQNLRVSNPVCQGDSGGSFYALLADGSLRLAGVIAAYQSIPDARTYTDPARQAENCLNFPYAHITGISAKRSWINAGINQLLAAN